MRRLQVVEQRHEEAARQVVSLVSEAHNGGVKTDTIGHYHDVGPGTLEMLNNGYGIVALVFEEDGWKEQQLYVGGSDSYKITTRARPSLRLRAIWRYMHMNYAALTDASDGLRLAIERAVLVGGQRRPRLGRRTKT